MIWVIIILAVVAVIGVFALGLYFERKRRDAFRQLAAELGFTFHSHRDYHFADRYQFLNKLAQGSNRYAYNILTGASDRGETVHIFDYHYETYSTDSKGNRQTHHHQFSFFILLMPRSFPELTIGREGFLSKIAQAVGYDDIDFESHEFSRKFCVRSRDKKFAYDVCNAQLIEYLLDNADLGIEIDGPALALGFSSRLNVEQVRGNLHRLFAVRSHLPEYLFS